MATYQEPMYLSDVLLVEVARGWTMQNVKVKTDTALAIGTVLFRTDSDHFIPTNDGGGFGEVVVLADNVKPSDYMQTTLAIVRGAVVATENLIFPDNFGDGDKESVVQMLNQMGIATQGEILPVVTQGESVQPPPPPLDPSSLLDKHGEPLLSSNVVTGEDSGVIAE